MQLFESREGLIALLNEQCLRNLSKADGQDASYVSAAVKIWGGGTGGGRGSIYNTPSTTGGTGGTGGEGGEKGGDVSVGAGPAQVFAQTLRMAKTEFSVQHYAGQVKYTVQVSAYTICGIS